MAAARRQRCTSSWSRRRGRLRRRRQRWGHSRQAPRRRRRRCRRSSWHSVWYAMTGHLPSYSCRTPPPRRARPCSPCTAARAGHTCSGARVPSIRYRYTAELEPLQPGFGKQTPRRQQDWPLKCPQGGRAFPLAACVATLYWKPKSSLSGAGSALGFLLQHRSAPVGLVQRLQLVHVEKVAARHHAARLELGPALGQRLCPHAPLPCSSR